MLLTLLVGCTDITQEKYTDEGSYYVEYESNPSPIPLNKYFTITVFPYADDTKSSILQDIDVFVDATMPAHGHGMNEQATMTLQEDGSFLAEGLKWHMEGLWELEIYVTQESTDTAKFEIECCY